MYLRDRIFGILFALISLTVGYLATTADTADPDLAVVKIFNLDGKAYDFLLEIALSRRQRALGLMFRQHLTEDGGMAFILPEPRIAKMWMKDTLLSLDMLFVNEYGVVQEVNSKCLPKSEKLLSSRENVRFVIELEGGTSARFGIRTGSVIEFPKWLVGSNSTSSSVR